MLASRAAGLRERQNPAAPGEIEQCRKAETTGAPPPRQQPQNLSVLAQYVKDLSFENPGRRNRCAAATAADDQHLASTFMRARWSTTRSRSSSSSSARQRRRERSLFAIELVYGGLFRLTNIPPDHQPLIMIECPRLLFPFARQIISDASRNGGFPPLLIDPVDFVSLYRQRLAECRRGSADQLA